MCFLMKAFVSVPPPSSALSTVSVFLPCLSLSCGLYIRSLLGPCQPSLKHFQNAFYCRKNKLLQASKDE